MWWLAALALGAPHPWPVRGDARPLVERVAPPPSHLRIALPEDSFGAWLRSLPVKPGRPDVRLHNGKRKRNQAAHFAVLDIDVGEKDLQQCADAVIRLFAEFSWAAGHADRICFRFTSGDRAEWSRWRAGDRPQVRGNRVRWRRAAKASDGYDELRRYLEVVFLYAGSRSLELDLEPVADPRAVMPGDVFIRGGFPGHAVLVMDVAERTPGGERVFLLAQSFMPAQEIHLLNQPDAESPWYPARPDGPLITPEWRFDHRDLRRFRASGCP
jgi:hypothetical protein